MAFNKLFVETFIQQTKDQMQHLQNQINELDIIFRQNEEIEIKEKLIFFSGQLFQLNVIYEWFSAILNEINEEEEMNNYSIV